MARLAGCLLLCVLPTLLAFSEPAVALPQQGDKMVAARQTKFILHGCPYNLDKSCRRNRHGKWVCHCVS